MDRIQRIGALFFAVAIVGLGRPATVEATVYLSVPEALAQAFPAPARSNRQTAFLTKDQMNLAQIKAGDDVPVTSALVTYFEGKNGADLIGTAYLDTHLVRTLPETVMIVVGTDGGIRGIEILSFKEPPDYLPPSAWINQFEGKEKVSKKSIRGITGATLTARSITRAVRRVMAIHDVLRGAKKS